MLARVGAFFGIIGNRPADRMRRFHGRVANAAESHPISHHTTTMNTSSQRTPATIQSLFSAGVAGWVLGMVAVFAAIWGLTKPESLFEVLMGALSFWWIAFAFGLVVLIVRGVLTKNPLGTALLAYLLPVAIIAGLAEICLAIYPDGSFRNDIAGFFPTVLVFYIFGLVWMSLRRAGSFDFVRAVLPPIFGGIMILAFVAWPTFTSNAFCYRNAFALTVQSSVRSDGEELTEAVLKISKPGHYRFAAPDFEYSDVEFGLASKPGEITWGAAGEPKEGSTGSFPLSIRCKNGSPPSERYPGFPSANSAVLEVRNADSPDAVIYTIFAKQPAQQEQ
jgi:hypothetical protein